MEANMSVSEHVTKLRRFMNLLQMNHQRQYGGERIRAFVTKLGPFSSMCVNMQLQFRQPLQSFITKQTLEKVVI